MEKEEQFETGCCPRFKPEKWNEKEIEFDHKLFLKDHITSLFHIPLNFGKVMKRDLELIEKAGAEAQDQLIMTEEDSPFGSEVYIAVDKKIPNVDIEEITGTFLTKVFEGSYMNMPAFVGEMMDFVESRGETAKKLYFYYVYCPKCAKDYGKNFTVILAEI